MAQPNPQPAPSVDNKIWAYLSFLLGWLFGLIGLAVVKNDDAVRFQCAQILLFDLAVAVVTVLLSFVFIGYLVWLAGFIYRIVLLVQYANGAIPRIPVCGDFAEKNLMKLFQ